MKKNAIVLMSFLCCITLLYTGCKKDDEFENLYADAGNDFLDIENDGYVVTLNAQAPPSGQSGIWRIYNGDYGVFQDLNNSISEFYGEPGETYLLGWEVADGNQYEASTINVSYVPMHPVIDMMVDDSTYNNISLYLGAEEAKFGAMGLWEITDGSGGRIENPESHNEALFIGEPKSEYTLRWTMTYGSKKEYEEISFITDELIADAGEDDLDIKSSEDEVKYFNLNAVLPAGATGTWEVLDGNAGMVWAINDPNSIFKGIADEEYSLLWNVTIDGYNSSDTLELKFRGKWGSWTDPRDEQSYRIVEAGGLEWMADNYNFKPDDFWYSQYGFYWYYGQTARANIVDGEAVETIEDRKYYGRLYNWYAADELTPEGWRLPTTGEFYDVLYEHGGPEDGFDDMFEGGATGLEINMSGYVSHSNNDPNLRDTFGDIDITGFYWTANYYPNEFASAVMIFKPTNGQAVGPLTSSYWGGYSVRYVRDIQ